MIQLNPFTQLKERRSNKTFINFPSHIAICAIVYQTQRTIKLIPAWFSVITFLGFFSLHTLWTFLCLLVSIRFPFLHLSFANLTLEQSFEVARCC